MRTQKYFLWNNQVCMVAPYMLYMYGIMHANVMLRVDMYGTIHVAVGYVWYHSCCGCICMAPFMLRLDMYGAMHVAVGYVWYHSCCDCICIAPFMLRLDMFDTIHVAVGCVWYHACCG